VIEVLRRVVAEAPDHGAMIARLPCYPARAIARHALASASRFRQTVRRPPRT
jgi:hypothetical protein